MEKTRVYWLLWQETTKIPKGVRNYSYCSCLALDGGTVYEAAESGAIQGYMRGPVVPIHKVAFYALTEILLCGVFEPLPSDRRSEGKKLTYFPRILNRVNLKPYPYIDIL